MTEILYNHVAGKLSDLELQMAKSIRPGGNWGDIPTNIPSTRLEQIRKSGGRTTYYGRLLWDKPSYTISTYFSRLGNGCHLHPEQNRLISIREGARLQSFRDNYVFYGKKTTQFKQIGNAVPPLLARAIAATVEKHVKSRNFVDLFAGAGGLSEGFTLQGFKPIGGIEIEKSYFETYVKNHQISKPEQFILGNIKEKENKEKLAELKNSDVGLIIGGPPCQGFSLAGWRNPQDDRNYLFMDFVELVEKIEPEFFVLENVPGILSARKGNAIKEIVSCFEKIGYYVNEPIKLHAEDFGVPQKRRRVFVIGSKKKARVTKPTPLFAENSNALPTFVTVRDAIGGLPKISSGGGEMETEFNCQPTNPYQEYLQGKETFEVFYKKWVQFAKNKRELVVQA